MEHSTALHIASFRGVDGVRLLLAKGAKVNAKSKAGYTPLRNAVERDRHDDAAGVRLLLEAGADASIRNDVGETAVHAAISSANGAPLCLKALLDFDADITPVKVRMNPGAASSFDERKHPWFTYLHSAAQHNMADVLRMLFTHARSKGIPLNPNVLDSEKHTPLHWIVQKSNPTGHKQATKVLLEFGANPLLATESCGNAVSECIKRFRPDIFEIFAEHGVNIDVPIDGAPLLQHLSKCYVDSKVLDMPIPAAVFAGRFAGPKQSAVYQQLIKTAVKAKASIPEGARQPWNLLHVIAEGGDAETVAAALKTDAGKRLVKLPVGEGVREEFSLPSWTCLHLAIDNKHAPAVMKALLDGGAVSIVNTEDADGMTPLHLAVARAAPHEVMKLVEMLMASGATPSTKNNAGVHVQHTAAERFAADTLAATALATLLSGASI
jgi:ankyrin repeat protein